MARHDHHPHEEYASDDPESEFGLPALACSLLAMTLYLSDWSQTRRVLTDISLLQKCQCIHVRPIHVVIEDVCIALVVDVGSGEKLYRGSDDSGDEKDEEDEGEEHHSAWEEFPLRDEDDLDDNEDDG